MPSLFLIAVVVTIIVSFFLKCSITADAWRRFSVLRLRQRNGAKRLLPAGLFFSYYSLF